jgi:hypothetical protein
MSPVTVGSKLMTMGSSGGGTGIVDSAMLDREKQTLEKIKLK